MQASASLKVRPRSKGKGRGSLKKLHSSAPPLSEGGEKKAVVESETARYAAARGRERKSTLKKKEKSSGEPSDQRPEEAGLMK